MNHDDVNALAMALCRDGEHDYAYSAPCPEHWQGARDTRVIPPAGGGTDG